MKVVRTIKNGFKKCAQKLNQFVHDEWGGSMVEYALLIGFALFIFFILVSIVTSTLDWTMNQSGNFTKLIDNNGG